MSSVQPLPLYNDDEQPSLVLTPELIGTINRLLSGLQCGSVEIRVQDGAFYTLKREESFRVASKARNRNRNR